MNHRQFTEQDKDIYETTKRSPSVAHYIYVVLHSGPTISRLACKISFYFVGVFDFALS